MSLSPKNNIDTFRKPYREYTWELVQAKKVRSVFRLTKDGVPDLFIKITHPIKPLQRLRNLFFPKTEKEAKKINALRSAGIYAPEVIAKLKNKSASALVTKGVPHPVTLSDLPFEEHVPVMLETANRLLSKGFTYGDMHAGNIVLDETKRPFIVDAYEISRPYRLKKRHAVNLFAGICSIYSLREDDITDYTRKLDIGISPEVLAERAFKKSKKLKRKQIRTVVERCTKKSSLCSEIKNERYRALIYISPVPDLTKLIDAHYENIENNRNLLKLQGKTQVSVVDDLCVKSFCSPRFPGSPYASRSWKGLMTLYFSEIPVAEPKAMVLFKDGSGLVITSFLHEPELDIVLHHDYETMDMGKKIELARSLAENIATMHSKGIYHADLKACNIKVALDDASYRFLDTDRVSIGKNVPKRRRIKNLVQLNTTIPLHVSRGVRMAFVKEYASILEEDSHEIFRQVWDISKSMEIVYRSGQGDIFESWY